MKKIMSGCSCRFDSSSAYEIKDPDMMYDKIIKNFEEFSQSGGEILSFWEDDVNISTLSIGAHEDYGICLTHDTYIIKRLLVIKNVFKNIRIWLFTIRQS